MNKREYIKNLSVNDLFQTDASDTLYKVVYVRSEGGRTSVDFRMLFDGEVFTLIRPSLTMVTVSA